MKIGELARLTGRSVHTIRWYEAERLIPGVRRDPQGRRTYSTEHVDWLGLLDRLRQTGMSVAQMREYAVLVRQGKASLERRRDLLSAHRVKAQTMLDDLRAAILLVDRKVAFYDEWLATGIAPPLPFADPPAHSPPRRPPG